MELARVIEYQASLSSYRATQDEDRAAQLELLIDMTKPKIIESGWHPLIATPFRYPPPHRHEARFRPLYGKNVFYGSLVGETSLYEHAFHFIKQRLHLKIGIETGLRTMFFVEAKNKGYIDIRGIKNYQALVDKNNYIASHEFVSNNPKISFILYPSCRDPQSRDNAAILDINHLEKNLKREHAVKFFFDNHKRQITWLDYQLKISWNQVK